MLARGSRALVAQESNLKVGAVPVVVGVVGTVVLEVLVGAVAAVVAAAAAAPRSTTKALDVVVGVTVLEAVAGPPL